MAGPFSPIFEPAVANGPAWPGVSAVAQGRGPLVPTVQGVAARSEVGRYHWPRIPAGVPPGTTVSCGGFPPPPFQPQRPHRGHL